MRGNPTARTQRASGMRETGDGPVFLAPIHTFERGVVHPDELEVMDTAWSLCVFKADPGIRLGLSFHAAAERPTLSRVDSKGAAASSGLEPGDVILEIDGQPVTSALAAASMLRGREGSIALDILRPARETGGQGFASTPAEAKAVVCIQAAWRGYDQRLAILFWDRTAILIQAAWRGTLTRWAVADWLNWHSVVSIQKVRQSSHSRTT